MTLSLMLLAAAAAGQPLRANDLPITRNRLDRTTPRNPAPVTPQRAATQVASTGNGEPIKGIRFIGAKAPAPVAAAAGRFIGKPATPAVLGELAAALSAAYTSSDVALYTIAIPQQDFANGGVVVSLTEGSIAKVEVAGDAGKHPLLHKRLARLTREKPLSRRTFERQLSLAQAIPGLTAAPQFADPGFNGALTLSVAPVQKHRKITAGFSNRGIDLLGGGQFDLRAEFYGAAIDGDEFSLAASAAGDLKRYRYGTAGYSAPIGADGLTLSASAAYLETRPKYIPIKGRAKQAALSLSYPVIRSFKVSTDASLSLEALNNDNAAFGNVIAGERTRVVRAAASHAVTLPKRSISGVASVSKGFDGLGARVLAPFAEASFVKGSATMQVAQAIGQHAAVRGTLSGQYTRDRLPAAERLTLGGETIGRGFDTAVLSGDRGYGGLLELAYQPLKADRFKNSEVYVFADGGRLTVLAPQGFLEQHYSLASAGAGVRAKYREKAELGLEAARVIDRPVPGYAEKWRLTVSWRVTR